eukprot:TRINITY_DN63128_c0_g1_i1.p1 TRINITY_DN63128_c0_g1~~TRINITY_DN63128_c0_g1_i1.p1  ORF type:complete len:380 (-),score=65.43 TRINITY_DN63128_c0_g1_i1:220-1359(-)
MLAALWLCLLLVQICTGDPDWQISFNNYAGNCGAEGTSCNTHATPTTDGPKVREYWVAAVERDWNYVPDGTNTFAGRPFDAHDLVFVGRTTDRIGGTYKKAMYRAYEPNFVAEKDLGPDWAHLGVVGPPLFAEVGDTIVVHFKNMATRPYSMHPHGVFYDKASEGTSPVAPNGEFTYTWKVPERAGPGWGDQSSVVWPYHPHIATNADIASGLFGAIIIFAKGQMTDNNLPKGVDRQFLTVWLIVDENQSHYLDENIATFIGPNPSPGLVDDAGFQESNLMHAINGYLMGNMPGLDMKYGEKVRWHLMGLGNEVDIHTVHWHAQTVMSGGRRSDVVGIFPGMTETADMIADNEGRWSFHCHVSDHLAAGMTAKFNVVKE